MLMLMMIGDKYMFNKIFEAIKEYNTIIIHRHSRPDGDALGSQIGLKNSIKSTFPDKNVKIVGDMTERLNWMGVMDEADDKEFNEALCIIVDTGSEHLISDTRYKNAKYVIKIDHHIPQGEYGDLAYVDTNSESCASIVAELIMSTDLIMTNEAAASLFTGMVTDSGRFRFQQTSPRTFNIAAYLTAFEFDTNAIYNKIYMDKLANVKLRAKMVDKFIVTENGFAYLINTKEEIKEYGLPINDISRGMVGIMSGIEEIKVWANFCEDESGDIYCEFRSNGENVNSIATKYGGGGHIQASGCTAKSFDVVKDIIKDLDNLAKGE